MARWRGGKGLAELIAVSVGEQVPHTRFEDQPEGIDYAFGHLSFGPPVAQAQTAVGEDGVLHHT